MQKKPFKNFKQNDELLDRRASFISDLKIGDIRIINLGGTEEVGKNMTALEYKDTILIINAGVQFSASKMPGVDYIIPNIKYLEDNRHKIKGVILTNSSLENSGALPFMLETLGNPRVYSRLFTSTLVQKRMDNRGMHWDSTFVPVEEDMNINIGDFDVNFFGISSQNSEYLSVAINTEYGNIIYTNDTRNMSLKSEKFNGKNNLLLIADSANIETGGTSITMQDVKNNLEKIIVGAAGKVFVTTFANNIYHIKNIVEICEKNNKKIVLQSRTITENIESAQEVGLIGDISRFIIKKEDISKYKNSELVIFISGDEGREFDNITKIVKNPSEIKVEENDTVIMATHPIIHNQRDAQNLKDTLSRLGAHSYHYKYSDMLITNCATFDELKNLHRLLLPKFFMPVYGCHYMLRVHADIERKIGTPENHIIVPDNGMIIEIRDKGTRISNTREKTESEIVVVDGNKIGKLHNVVIKDRETLGAQGVFFAIILLDMRSHKIKKAPDIATRGFIFLKNSQDIINGSRVIIDDMMSDYLEKNRHIEIDDIKSDIQISLQKYLMMKTAKEPVVIPLIIKV